MPLTNSVWLFPFSPSFQTYIFVSDSGESAEIGSDGNVLLVQNLGPGTVFFLCDGTGTVPAVPANGIGSSASPMTVAGTAQPLLSGAIATFLVSPAQRYCSAICSAGETAALYLSRGTGQ